MTIPLWCLAGFVALAIVLLLALLAARLRHLASGGSVADFGRPDERRLVWRLFRAHANATENLPLFASVVVIAALAGVQGPLVDALAVTYLVARTAHAAVHVAGLAGSVRLACLSVQVLCLAGFLAAFAGLGS